MTPDLLTRLAEAKEGSRMTKAEFRSGRTPQDAQASKRRLAIGGSERALAGESLHTPTFQPRGDIKGRAASDLGDAQAVTEGTCKASLTNTVAPGGSPGIPRGGRSVPNLSAVEALDTNELYEGYRDGRSGEPEPGDNRSDSYWHGWRNGAADSGRRAADSEQRLIVQEYLAAQRGRA